MFRNVLSFSLLLFFCSPAFAQELPLPDVYQVYRLPQGTLEDTKSGKKMCYNLDQYRDLLHLDNDLHLHVDAVTELRKASLESFVAHTELSRALEISTSQLQVMTESRDKFFADWKKENLLRHKAENKVHWVPWAISGLAVSVASGLLLSIVVAQ